MLVMVFHLPVFIPVDKKEGKQNENGNKER
jgi:hypothetical protein